MKQILLALHEKLSTQVSLFYLKAIAIFIVAVFTFAQWVLPLIWERSTNFEFHFDSFDDGSVLRAQPYHGFDGHCLIWGELVIENKSKAPLHIKNTNLAFIPYDLTLCEQDASLCVAPVDHPFNDFGEKPLIKYEMKDLQDRYHSKIIHPITQAHDLFPGGKATRPFIVSIPSHQIKKQRLTVVAEQEFGRSFCTSLNEEKWYLPHCELSRAVIHIPSPCV